MINPQGLDLNLLVVLDALLQEAHASRAAQRVGLLQPATSNALERLRQLFGDPLQREICSHRCSVEGGLSHAASRSDGTSSILRASAWNKKQPRRVAALPYAQNGSRSFAALRMTATTLP